jgi:hypothetical protein
MSLSAMGLLSIDVGEGSAVAHCALGRGDGVQMLWVHAGAVSAGVINHIAFRQIAMDGEPRDPMCPAVHATKKEGSIPILVQWALPQGAAS